MICEKELSACSDRLGKMQEAIISITAALFLQLLLQYSLAQEMIKSSYRAMQKGYDNIDKEASKDLR